MDIDLYVAFVAATTVMILLPGPSVLLTVAHSLGHGWRPALFTVAGATCGVGIQLAVTLAGMTWFLVLLADGFEWLRWAGVAVLVYLGVQQWRADPGEPELAPSPARRRSLFAQGLAVTTVNPKSLVFLAAFFPQFIDPAVPLAVQLPILAASFLVITFAFTALWAVLASRAGGLVRTRRGARVRNRLAGGLMIGAGLGLALARRA